MTPETIGKYQLIKQIGRGDQGTIWRAHDPVLDRPVALKVISTDADVTDHLRARFFGEAHASARLSHPNIVTLYDMGEHEGRLFIVMEYLEGEELKHFIARRQEMALEDKLSIMSQVCDGLHYAHEKGVVHRSVKPGSIMLLRDGQAKLLDFGIAQIANAESDLTRTALATSTLPYMSPEHLQGRVDHRSDIFSVGAVFYEFLSLRPPFARGQFAQLPDNPWSEPPPPLDRVDPTIPPELAAIVARAMRTAPSERWADLDQMRVQLERVHRGLIEEASRVRARVGGHSARLQELQAALAQRVGPPSAQEALPAIDERGPLAAILRLEEEIQSRIEIAHMKIAKADLLAPALQLATDLLERGQAADAIIELEAIVAEMPEHARARAHLGQARGEVERERRSLLADTLLREARSAHEQRDHALCLEMLDQTADITLSVDVAQQIEALRRMAQEALTAEQASHRGRSRAEAARDQMAQARRTAQPLALMGHSRDQWEEAEGASARAQAAFGRSAYGAAEHEFAAAAAAYRRLAEAARDAQRGERRAAEQARDEATRGRASAQEERAPEFAAALWEAAEAKYAAAEGAFTKEEARASAPLFAEALTLYRRAKDGAAEARSRAGRRAHDAGERAAEAQRAAVASAAPSLAPLTWNKASATSADAQTDLAQDRYVQAADRFDAACELFRQAERDARQLWREQRDGSEQRRRAAAERRGLAAGRGAQSLAAPEWNEAEASLASGEAAHTREAYLDAIRAFEQAAALFRRAEERAGEAARALEAARAEAEQGRDATAQAREAAAAARASTYALAEWRVGEGMEARATAAVSRRDYDAARSLFADATRQYSVATQRSRASAEVEAQQVEALTADARRLLASGDPEACLRRLEEVRALRPEHAAAAALRLEAEGQLRQRDASPGGATAIPETVARRDHATGAVDQTTCPAAGEPAARTGVPRGDDVEGARVARPASAHSATAADNLSQQIGPAPLDALEGWPRRRHAARFSPVASDVDEAESAGVGRGIADTRKETGRPWGRWAGGAALVLGALAILVIAPKYWVARDASPPPAPGPATTPAPNPSAEAQRSAEELATRARGAREAALRAQEDARAPGAFADAAKKARDGDVALDRQDWAAAQQRYRESLEAFDRAKAEASRPTLPPRAESGARAAETRVAEARRGAELAGAPKVAGALWAKAAAAQRQAEDALAGRAFEQAGNLFLDAEAAYRAAERMARSTAAESESASAVSSLPKRPAEVIDQPRAGPPKTRNDAQQARARMATAKRAAEQAVAAFFATRPFNAAQGKERDGIAALEQSDYDTATRLLTEAHAAYQAAIEEAKRESAQQRQLAPLKARVEQSRATTIERRAEALTAEADRLAQDLFEGAQVKHLEADALAARQALEEAAQAYQDAADRYKQAALRAGRR